MSRNIVILYNPYCTREYDKVTAKQMSHLFEAANAFFYALQLGVTDVSKLKLWHGHHFLILSH